MTTSRTTPRLQRWRRVVDDSDESIIPVASVAGGLFLGAGLLGATSSTLTALFADPTPDFRPAFVIAASLVAVAIGIVTIRIGDRVPFPLVILSLGGGILLAALGTYFSGPSFGPFSSTFFVWAALASAMFTTRPIIAAFLVSIGVAEAVVLYAQDSAAPVSRWLLVFGTCVVTAVLVDVVMSRLTQALNAEHAARQLLTLASQHKSDFLASMSHELRTPLNAIIGFSDVLAAQHFGELNERQREYVADVQEAGRHLLSLINDILDLSKIESGAMELDGRTFALFDTIDSALNLVRTRAEENRVELCVEGAPADVFGDERRIKQVLANLLSNAVKFTPPGGSISVAVVDEVAHIRVSVTDTGIGIAAEDLERIFDDFQQVGDASTAAEGTGLGLALCRRLVELHGGTIEATSVVGQGSTFTFTLPRAAVPKATA